MLGDSNRPWGQSGQAPTGWNQGSYQLQQQQKNPNWGTQPSPQRGDGWGVNGTVGGNWNNSQKVFPVDREELLWASSPGFNTGTQNRSHSRASSWSVNPTQPVRQEPWEAISGYSNRQAAPITQAWGSAALDVPVSGSSWNSPDNIRRQEPTWAPSQLPQTIFKTPVITQSGWAPSGWDPLPTKTSTEFAKWDGQRPGGVTIQPSTIPRSTTPSITANATLTTTANTITVGDKIVKFEVVEEPVSPPLASIPITDIASGRRVPIQSDTLSPEGDQRQQILRKARSTPGLDRKFNGNQPQPQQPPPTTKTGVNGMWKKEGIRSIESKENLVEEKISVETAKIPEIPRDPFKATGVYIYGFPNWVKVPEIIEIFTRYGTIVNVGLVGKPKQKERVYAYVDYEVTGSAAKAVEALKPKLFFEMTQPLELKLHFDKRDIEPIAQIEPPSTQPSYSAIAASGPPSRSASPAIPSRPTSPPTIQSAVSKIGHMKKDSKDSKGVIPTKNGATLKDTKKKEEEKTVDLKTLHIANVPPVVGKGDLEKAFSVYGDIKRIHVVQRPKEKRSFAFVSYRDEASAKKATAAIKVTKLFKMNEFLKAEYSRLVAPVEVNIERPEVEKTDKMWKKGEALKLLETNDKKKEEKKKDKKPDPLPKKDTPTVIYVAHFAEENDGWKNKFAEFGVVKSTHIVKRALVPIPTEFLEATSGVESAHTATLTFALISFADHEEAAKAVAEKVVGGVFPRQRRVVARGFKNATEEDVRAWFATAGEVRKVEVYNVIVEAEKLGVRIVDYDKEEVWWNIEFMRPDGAARSLLKSADELSRNNQVKIHAEYAPSARIPKKGTKTAEEHKVEEAAAAAAEEAETQAIAIELAESQ
ncbi:hypothetical protein HK096_009693, partial [Nowakowskiella sp. JEL0078]